MTCDIAVVRRPAPRRRCARRPWWSDRAVTRSAAGGACPS